MGAEKEKIDRLLDLLRFIDLMVRQTCRRAHYDHLTRTKASKEDKDSIYSIDHLKKVYDKPREYVYQLVKNPQKTLKGLRVENIGPLPKKDNKFTKIEQKMLLDFVKKVQEQAPKAHFVWIDLQHYLFYTYRNFACQVPKTTSETLSAFFVCEMRELLNYLRVEDESQVWLRIFTLLREYCIFAQWHYSQNDKDEALKKFFAYYEAMLTAAKSLVAVFADFEKDIIFKNYRVCWIDFNTFIFIRFFYESDRVKTKVDECLKTKKSPGDTPQTFASMNKLKKTWADHEKRVALYNQERKLPDNMQEGIREKRVLAAHKKLLSATFWVDRTKDAKKVIDLDRMDDNLFDLLKDKHFFPEGPGLNKNGQCICEECLIAKYKCYLDSNDDFSFIATEERTTYCRRCKCILSLDQFQRHVNGHIEDLCAPGQVSNPLCLGRTVTEKMDVIKLGDSTVQLSEMFNDKLKISAEVNIDINKVKKYDIASTKLAYEKFLQNRKDAKVGDKVKNGRTPSLRDELIANGFGKALKDESEKSISPSITPEKLAETELMLREMRKNGHRPSQNKASEECIPIASSESFLPPKKCSCTYCEVFGVQRVIEPRDKLRVRLYRRKERRRENKGNQKILDHELSSKFKGDSRVPLPPSPSNFPATPPDLSEPLGSGSKMNEIRGLVNYIEGNSGKSKAEIANKKAAKKARQREKKEQDKLQAEFEAQKKLEELARQEEERKKLLQKEKEQLEELRKIEETKLKKKLKKQRQAQRRQDIAIQKNTIEETIPAIVTIKRVPGGENGTPSVTITLKGCTPDQDKLLTTLVEEPHVETITKVSSTSENNHCKITEGKNSKKKRNTAKSNYSSTPEMQNSETQESTVVAKVVKVTLAVDKTPVSIVSDPYAVQQEIKEKVKEVKRERQPTEEEIRSLGNLRLPPGITITKVEGPVTSNKTYMHSDSNKGSSVLGKSGVIVVDTEKLIQKSETDYPKAVKTSKKKKKKNKKAADESKDKPKMVTLRNPMFQPFQAQNLIKPPVAIDESAPAAIFTRENGMVTIRSSRLQQSLDKGLAKPSNVSQLGIPLIPDLLSQVPNFSNPNPYSPEHTFNGFDKPKEETSNIRTVSSLDAQEILSGLPGIEITKIDNKNEKVNEMEIDNSCQDAQVSITPSNDTDFSLELGKEDDWLYDNVFKPRDVLEDDMDDEELELEAFKRFCQQSVPPKEKTVAHFNVADIVLKKKLT
ncbi:uncharacterized protein [Euwallacea fornicatus]|uniref:uncharacterized protein isoform X1 n=1 Tax=Euwallacea fornicatus TaxID=995702 RepID=UPI00338D9A9F